VTVTVIPAPQSVRGVPATVSTTSTSQEQKKKDADARWILETELKKLEARQTDLKTEYNQGAPEKQGAESRNHQKYLDRIAQLKDNLSRNAEDIAGLRRELERLSVNR
jgi:predicted RNase H-like nuclease (RuvC/YqgF family)